MTMQWTALLVPLAGLALAVGVLLGGRALQVLAVLSAVGFGVATVLTLASL
jgi:hypothetical protein